MENYIQVEVAYATPLNQKIISLKIEKNSTLLEVIQRSGILLCYPEIDLTQQKVGIFSEIKKLTDIVKENDRVEIYRPLMIDPKEARKERAKK